MCVSAMGCRLFCVLVPWVAGRDVNRTERTELEPTFWVEPNRTRTGQLATDVELEPN